MNILKFSCNIKWLKKREEMCMLGERERSKERLTRKEGGRGKTKTKKKEEKNEKDEM